MKSPAQEAYEEVKTKLLRAPGMIEESERRLLFKAAFNCPELPVVEFGAFFGASTLALASGLSKRKTNQNKLICIDAFEVEKENCFHKHVLSFARNCKAEQLLTTNGEKTNWMKVTKAVLGSELKTAKLIKGVVNDNLDMSFLPEKIGLLHLDLPKDAKTIAPILKGAFPKLTQGSVIAFQDYAYQFSNELIALFELLEQNFHIKPINIAASSIFYEVCTDNLKNLDLESLLHRALSNQNQLIKEAISKYKAYPSRRPQELIALHGAAIWAIKTQSGSITFNQQAITRKLIQEMTNIDIDRAAFVLTELLTEKI